MSDLALLADWAAPLLARLSPEQTRAAMRDIALELRRSQSKRIASQRNADGSPFPARKPRRDLRDKKGRIRRAMFMKMRTAKYMRIEPTPVSASVAFVGRVSRIARVHQYGLRDKVDFRESGSRTAKYEVRQLLGFTAADVEMITERLLHHASLYPA